MTPTRIRSWKSEILRTPWLRILTLPWLLGLTCIPALSGELDEMSLDRWAKLREVERYQLNVAEEYFRKKDWKVALAEYEKYLTLYEASVAAPYAQLKWSLCQIELRKANTAIKDGFQSVIDYWPDSPEAVAAGYYIGRTYKDMGQTSAAKKAYRSVIEKHAEHHAAVRAAADLIEIAGIENDRETQVQLWKTLAFDIRRTKSSQPLCIEASRQLASHYFAQVAFNDGVKSLATSYQNEPLLVEVAALLPGPLKQLAARDETRPQAEALASKAAEYFRLQAPSDATEGEARMLARQCWYSIADSYAAAGLETKVEETYAQIVQTFGAEDDTLERLADWHKSLRRFDDARGVYRRFQDRIEGLNRIGRSYREEGRPDSAVATYQELANRDASNRAKWMAEAAASLHEAKKYKDAIDIYQELLRSDIENAETWRWRVATAYRDAGQFKDAIAWYRQCTNFSANYREMAACQRRLKQYGEAKTLYAQIIGGDPAWAPWAMLQLAFTCEEAGEQEQAIKTLQKICQQFPKDRYASQAHAHLQSKYNISITLGGAKED